MWQRALCLKRLKRSDGSEQRIACSRHYKLKKSLKCLITVIGAAAAVQLAVAHDGRVRVQTVAPCGRHGRLFVHVAVPGMQNEIWREELEWQGGGGADMRTVPPSPPVEGTSMNMSGVRLGSCSTSHVSPGTAWAATHCVNSSTTFWS